MGLEFWFGVWGDVSVGRDSCIGGDFGWEGLW